MIDERKYRRRTIRLLPFVDEELEIIAKKNNVTVNKLVSEIIMYHINDTDKADLTVTINSIVTNLEMIQSDINNLQRQSNWLSSLTKQIFVNSGFARNREENDDKVYQEFVNKRYKNNEEKYNA